jgi:hypothetical protein
MPEKPFAKRAVLRDTVAAISFINAAGVADNY